MAEETVRFAFKSLILIHFVYKHPPVLENKDIAQSIIKRCCPELAAPLPGSSPSLGSTRALSLQEGACKTQKQPPNCRTAFLCNHSNPTWAMAMQQCLCSLCLLSLAFKMFSNLQRTNKQNPCGLPLNSMQDPQLVDIHQQEMSATSEQLV